MIFGCEAASRSHASISALKLLSLHMCGAAALWRCKTAGWCLTGCGRACCDTGSAAHSHPVTVDKPMHKSVLVHPPIILRTMLSVGDSFDASAKALGEILRVRAALSENRSRWELGLAAAHANHTSAG